MTDPLKYVDLNLPVDTITQSVEGISIAISLVDDLLIGQLIIKTADGHYQFLLHKEPFVTLVGQAVRFHELHGNPDQFAKFITELRRQANEVQEGNQ
jgi:hypothetical protein